MWVWSLNLRFRTTATGFHFHNRVGKYLGAYSWISYREFFPSSEIACRPASSFSPRRLLPAQFFLPEKVAFPHKWAGKFEKGPPCQQAGGGSKGFPDRRRCPGGGDLFVAMSCARMLWQKNQFFIKILRSLVAFAVHTAQLENKRSFPSRLSLEGGLSPCDLKAD